MKILNRTILLTALIGAGIAQASQEGKFKLSDMTTEVQDIINAGGYLIIDKQNPYIVRTSTEDLPQMQGDSRVKRTRDFESKYKLIGKKEKQNHLLLKYTKIEENKIVLDTAKTEVKVDALRKEFLSYFPSYIVNPAKMDFFDKRLADITENDTEFTVNKKTKKYGKTYLIVKEEQTHDDEDIIIEEESKDFNMEGIEIKGLSQTYESVEQLIAGLEGESEALQFSFTNDGNKVTKTIRDIVNTNGYKNNMNKEDFMNLLRGIK